jgi:hypothetical protein
VWDEDTIQLVMTACIIMHNMIVEVEGVDENDFRYDEVGEKVTVSHDDTPEFDAFMQNYKEDPGLIRELCVRSDSKSLCE